MSAVDFLVPSELASAAAVQLVRVLAGLAAAVAGAAARHFQQLGVTSTSEFILKCLASTASRR